MKTTKSLVLFRREIWEHRASVIGVFAAMGILFFVIALLGLAQHDASDISINITIYNSDHEGEPAGKDPFDVEHALKIGLNNFVVSLLYVFLMISYIVAIYYLLGSLYDDRKDRSILFWKSMPVSETQNVLTKYLTGLFIIPFFALTIGLITSFFLGLLFSFWLPTASGYSFTYVWQQLNFMSGVYTAMGFIVTSAAWAAPFCAWLAFASAISKRSPLLWAVVPPLLFVITEQILFGKSLLQEMLMRYLPDCSLTDKYSDTCSWNVLATLMNPLYSLQELTIGAIVSALLLAAAIWLRNNRYEL